MILNWQKSEHRIDEYSFISPGAKFNEYTSSIFLIKVGVPPQEGAVVIDVVASFALPRFQLLSGRLQYCPEYHNLRSCPIL